MIKMLLPLLNLVLFLCRSSEVLEAAKTADLDIKHSTSMKISEPEYLMMEPSPSPKDPTPQIINQKYSKKVVSKDSSVILNCTLNVLSQKPVLWTVENETLAVDGHRYRKDKRVQPLHQTGSPDYSLLISDVSLSDSGYYACRLESTDPQGITVKLEVIEAYSVIFGGKDIAVATGQTLYLYCMVLEVSDIPDYILWYHEKLVIEYQRKTIQVIMDAETRSSELRIHNITFVDSGQYTCRPSNAAPSHVTVFVHQAIEYLEGGKTNFTKWILLIQMLATFAFFFGSYVIACILQKRSKCRK